MTIKRVVNGKTMMFTLHASELMDAYFEQQKEFDVADAKSYMEDQFLDAYVGYTEEQIEPYIPAIAESFRELQNEQDWWPDMETAFLSNLPSAEEVAG